MFRTKLLQFQEIVATTIAVYFRNIYLKSFLVIATLAYTQDKRFTEYRFMLSKVDEETEQTEGLGLCTGLTFAPIIGFLNFLLDDPKGAYFIDEVQYADITLHLMMKGWVKSVISINLSLSEFADRCFVPGRLMTV